MEPTPTPVHTHRKKLSGRTVLALWLMLGPTVLIAAVLLVFAMINLIFNPTFWPTPDTEDFANTPFIITITNIILFALGTFATVAWLPGVVIGAILLIRRPKQSV